MIKKLGCYCLLPALISLIIFSCTEQPAQKPAGVTIAKTPVIMKPFHYHKVIEVAPGQDFDVMSWGTPHKGSLLILHTDSANNKFTTTTGDLEGAITDVFNSDMDTDGNPEVLIEAKAKDTVDYTAIYAYEFTDSKANKLDFPKLTKTQKTGYRGNDNFYMKDGKLIREFPIYDGNTVAAKSTGQKRVLQYNLHSNTLTVKDLSADTLKKSAAAIKADSVSKSAVAKKLADRKPETKKSKKEKAAPKHKRVVKMKRKHHRHREE